MANEEVTTKLLEAYVVPDVNLDECSEYPIVATRKQVSWPVQFVTCLGRVMKDAWRNRTMLYLNLFQSCVVSFFIGLTFLKMGQSNASQVKRRNLLFLIALNQGVCGAFLAINTFPPERALMLRERANGMYRASAYFLAKNCGDLIGQIICPWVFACICYWMVRAAKRAEPAEAPRSITPCAACGLGPTLSLIGLSPLPAPLVSDFSFSLHADRAQHQHQLQVLHLRLHAHAYQHRRRLARHGGEWTPAALHSSQHHPPVLLRDSCLTAAGWAALLCLFLCCPLMPELTSLSPQPPPSSSGVVHCPHHRLRLHPPPLRLRGGP